MLIGWISPRIGSHLERTLSRHLFALAASHKPVYYSNNIIGIIFLQDLSDMRVGDKIKGARQA